MEGKRRIVASLGIVPLVVLGCAASRSTAGGGDGGVPDASLPDGCADPEGCVDPDPDRDDDGIPDFQDPDPDEPAPTVLDEPFDSDPGDAWRAEGPGEWLWTEDGRITQTAPCENNGAPTTFEAVDIDLADLFVEAVAWVAGPTDECEDRRVGVFARKRDGGFVGCTFEPILPMEGDEGPGASTQGMARLIRFSGGEQVELGSQATGFPRFVDREIPWSERPVRLAMTLDGNDAYCFTGDPDDPVGSWGAGVPTGFDTSTEPGTAGLLTWGTPAAFDDFRALSLE